MQSATAIRPHTEIVFKDSEKYVIVTEFVTQHSVIRETVVVVCSTFINLSFVTLQPM